MSAEFYSRILVKYLLGVSNKRLTFEVIYVDRYFTLADAKGKPFRPFRSTSGFTITRGPETEVGEMHLCLPTEVQAYDAPSCTLVFETNRARDFACRRIMRALDQWAARHKGRTQRCVEPHIN